MKRLIPAREAARRIGVTEQTLANWRYLRNKGPRFYKVGGSVKYAEEDLEAWLESCAVEGANDAA